MCTGWWKMCDVGTVGPVGSVRHSGSWHPTIASLPVHWCSGLCLHLHGLSLTCPVVHSSSKSEILVLLIVNWPEVFLRDPCWAQSYTWSTPLLSELSCVAMVSGFKCTRTTLNGTLAVKTTKVEDVVSARTRVEVCLRELNQWMLLNNLRLNNDRTELLVLHAKHRPQPLLHTHDYCGWCYCGAHV